jgi:uncharacterized protein
MPLKKQRIVLDTNVLLVSISDRSPLHWIYQGFLNDKYDLCVSTDILDEYAEILERFMGITVAEMVVGTIVNRRNTVFTTVFYRFNLLDDVDDNKFVDCAIASNAQFIVSEDKSFQKLKKIPFPPVTILRLKEFEKTYK